MSDSTSTSATRADNPYPQGTPGYQDIAYDPSPENIAQAATLYGSDGYAIGNPGEPLPEAPVDQPWWTYLTPALANPSGIQKNADGSYGDPSLGVNNVNPFPTIGDALKDALIIGAVVLGAVLVIEVLK